MIICSSLVASSDDPCLRLLALGFSLECFTGRAEGRPHFIFWSVHKVFRALLNASPDPVAIACMAVGISVWPLEVLVSRVRLH